MKDPIQNPILKGFNPDPSIVRVEGDYYVATSTFEWFPGVQIHHSRDLRNWRLVNRPLNRPSQLDMRGNPDSGGVWAPCLSYDQGVFYLAYTDVKVLASNYKATRNYLSTSESIDGDWSDPILLEISGFDPSLFHDADGRKWIVSMTWDHRGGINPFYGIQIVEFDAERRELIGEPKLIFKGTSLGCTEGPHLYRKNGYYYLITAEGGTGITHAVTLARSKNLFGPYEVAPQNPIVTSHGHDEAELKRSGHADIVETQNGDWYLVHLCSRPLPGKNRSVLGRETAIQKIVWSDDDWIELESGGNCPSLYTPSPGLREHAWPSAAARCEFDGGALPQEFQTLRKPLGDDSLSLAKRPGHLRLKGGDPLASLFDPVVVARRQQSHRFNAGVCLEFNPQSFQEMAGLLYYYSTTSRFFFFVSRDEALGRVLNISIADKSAYEDFPIAPIAIDENSPVHLKMEVDFERLVFSYSLDGYAWTQVDRVFDCSILSDERGGDDLNFTGAFIGMACVDLTNRRRVADFDYFEYQEQPVDPIELRESASSQAESTQATNSEKR